jgi:hypothetical protein
MEFIEKCSHSASLQFGIAENGRAATNFSILFLNLRSSSFGNPRGKKRLKGQRNQVAVKKEVLEEIVCFWDLV